MNTPVNEYIPLEENWDEELKPCCEQPSSTDREGTDCCYDDWKKRLRFVSRKFDSVCVEASIKQDKLTLMTLKQDRLKIWYEELSKADDLTHVICGRLKHITHHIHDIYDGSRMTVHSVNILFCMIKDLYTQIDKIKIRYDYIINCIKCINDPTLEPGKGLLKCLDDYYQKVDAVIKTRDNIIALILLAVKLSNQINQNLDPEFGIANTFQYWKYVFRCWEEHEETEQEDESPAKRFAREDLQIIQDEKSHIGPILTMPICDDEYYKQLKDDYDSCKENVRLLSNQLTDLNRKKEKLQACKKSLEDAIKEVDPKNRCK